MKSVMISIRPEWVQKILSGEKTVEVRKTVPKIATPFKCYIYCTLSGCNEFFRDTLKGDVAEWNRGKWADRKGSVVAEFICDKVERFDVPYPAFQNEMNKSILKQSCLTYYQLHRYAYHDKLYGWHISNLKVYDVPKALRTFYQECPGLYNTGLCWDCEKAVGEECDCATNGRLFLNRPPQSWCYVEE